MTQESIFSGATPPGEEVNQNPSQNNAQVPQELTELVGDGKKYKTVEDALKSVPHAQAHIQKLEEELAAKNEALMKAKAVEDLLEELKKTGQPPTPAQQAQIAEVKVDPNEIIKTVDQVVAQRLAAQEQARLAQANTTSVVKAFTQKFGAESEKEYIKIAQESGLSIESLNRLAATSPAAVLKLAGIQVGQEVNHTPNRTVGNVNTEAFRNQTTQGQTQSARVVGGKTSDLVSAWRNAKPTE